MSKSGVLITVDSRRGLGQLGLRRHRAHRRLRGLPDHPRPHHPREAREAAQQLLAEVLGSLMAGQEWRTASEAFGHAARRPSSGWACAGRSRSRSRRPSPTSRVVRRTAGSRALDGGGDPVASRVTTGVVSNGSAAGRPDGAVGTLAATLSLGPRARDRQARGPFLKASARLLHGAHKVRPRPYLRWIPCGTVLISTDSGTQEPPCEPVSFPPSPPRPSPLRRWCPRPRRRPGRLGSAGR